MELVDSFGELNDFWSLDRQSSSTRCQYCLCRAFVAGTCTNKFDNPAVHFDFLGLIMYDTESTVICILLSDLN